MRKQIKRDRDGKQIIEIGSVVYRYEQLDKFAEIGNFMADVIELVIRTEHGQFARLFLCYDETPPRGSDVPREGWYVSSEISTEDAVKVRKSWEVLRPQPNINGSTVFQDVRRLTY